MSNRFTRRRFLQTAAAAVLAPTVLTRSVRAAPSERITLGFIGVGMMGGHHHVGQLLNQKDVQVVAVCDVVAERREHFKHAVEKKYAEAIKSGAYKGCQAYIDFRELLGRKDIDAVVIATPDHWHAIPCIEAAKAKKDIYCEKPLTHSIVEGRRIVEAVAQNQIVFQTGSQQRSEFGGHFRRAVELVRNGVIGKVHTIHIGVGGPPVKCDLPEQPTPEGTDWNLWVGPAAMRGYNEILCPKGVHHHFPAWRNYKEYAGGGLADMGAHHFDIAQWALDMDAGGPVKIEPPQKGTSGLKFTYANGVVMIHGYPPEADQKFKGKHRDCIFEGSNGTVFVSRGGITTEPQGLLEGALPNSAWKPYASSNQHRNWLDCIRSRKECICTAEIGHRSATICHLGAIGYELRRPLAWDPVKERFDDAAANKLLDYERRGEWKI
jgi:predicted dehydrogenase